MKEKRYLIIITKDNGESKGQVEHKAFSLKAAEDMARKITHKGEYFLVIPL